MEGADLVAAGLAAGHHPQVVFLREEAADELGARLGLIGYGGDEGGPAGAAAPARSGPPPGVFAVDERVAARISTLETPADAMAIFPLPERGALSSLPALAPLVVYVDGVQDPGNVGTLIRAAVLFGADALVTSLRSADPYGPKTVRASMGAVFGLRLFSEATLAEVAGQLPEAEVYGLSAHEGEPLAGAGLRRPAILAIGAERSGLSRASLARVTRPVTIPLAAGAVGAVESLNAGVAGAIALYEFSRRPAAPQEG